MTDQPQVPGSGLSDEQRAYLVESAEFTPEELTETEAAVARGELADEERRTGQAAIDATLGVPEVADRLGVNADEVVRLLATGGLYALTVGAENRFPTWQFTGDSAQPTLPNLEHLVRAFPDDWGPATVLGFMTTPQPSARIDGVAQTPADWLTRGGDPVKLREILDSFLMT